MLFENLLCVELGLRLNDHNVVVDVAIELIEMLNITWCFVIQFVMFLVCYQRS